MLRTRQCRLRALVVFAQFVRRQSRSEFFDNRYARNTLGLKIAGQRRHAGSLVEHCQSVAMAAKPGDGRCLGRKSFRQQRLLVALFKNLDSSTSKSLGLIKVSLSNQNARPRIFKLSSQSFVI